MNCPRCKAEIGPLASPDAIVTCPGCGTRLMTRAAALRSQGASNQPTKPSLPPAAESSNQPTKPSLPPAAEGLGSDTSPAPSPERAAVTHSQSAVAPKPAGEAVLAGGRKAAVAAGPAILEKLLAEIQAVRETQHLILEALGGLRLAQGSSAASRAPDGADGVDERESPSLHPIRASRRKSVVLVDDDPQTRQAAVAELEHADIPVRAFAEGNQALSGIAEEKPDVIILELAVEGELGGKDLVNMIKATMEWVDIPIVLWTREEVANQKEARQIHGADEVVIKSQGPAALVARVITVFRR
jgi:CheY-like chemotaxis protein